jgi:hypothetical protein
MRAGSIAALRFPLPLTMSASIGLPGEPRALPHVYGNQVPCWGAGIPTNDKYTWIVAHHHVDELLGVSGQDTAGEKIAYGTLVNTVDPDGRTIAAVRLGRIASGVPLFLVRGKSGNPADIIWDLLANVAGLPVLRSELAAFRQQTMGIELAGRIEDPTKSLRAQIDEVALNAGAIWSRGRVGIAELLPIASDPVRSFTRKDLFNMTAPETSIEGLRNQIRVLYNSRRAGVVKQRFAGFRGAAFGALQEHPSSGPIAAFGASGRVATIDAPSGELEMSLTGRVPASIRRYGVHEATLELRWVQTMAQAARVLGLALDEGQRPPVVVSADIDLDLDLAPGDRVEVDDPHLPDIGPWLVTSADPDIAGHKTAITLRAYAGGEALTTVIDYPDPDRAASFFVGYGSADDNDRDIDETVTEEPDDGTEESQLPEQPGQVKQPESMIVAVSDETTPVIAGDSLRGIRMPYDMDIFEIQASAEINTVTSPARVRVRPSASPIDVVADFYLNMGSLGGFTPVPISNFRSLKSSRLIFDVVSAGSGGTIAGLKFNVVGRQP